MNYVISLTDTSAYITVYPDLCVVCHTSQVLHIWCEMQAKNYKFVNSPAPPPILVHNILYLTLQDTYINLLTEEHYGWVGRPLWYNTFLDMPARTELYTQLSDLNSLQLLHISKPVTHRGRQTWVVWGNQMAHNGQTAKTQLVWQAGDEGFMIIRWHIMVKLLKQNLCDKCRWWMNPRATYFSRGMGQYARQWEVLVAS